MLSAREVKSADEIALLNRAAAMVDGAYDVVNQMLRPGVRENDIVAEVTISSTRTAPTTSKR